MVLFSSEFKSYNDGIIEGKSIKTKEIINLLNKDLEHHNKRRIEHQKVYLKKKKENKNKLFYADLQKEIRHKVAIKYIEEFRKKIQSDISTKCKCGKLGIGEREELCDKCQVEDGGVKQ